jgi:hypothetical protein
MSPFLYTTIHLNVSPQGESRWTGWLRKFKWVLIAISAPEIVVFTAFQEWLKARVFLKELNKISNQGSSPEVKLPMLSTSDTQYFGTSHSVFIQGVFSVSLILLEMDPLLAKSPENLPPPAPRMNLFPQGSALGICGSPCYGSVAGCLLRHKPSSPLQIRDILNH